MSVFTSVTSTDLAPFLAQYPVTATCSLQGIAAGISNSNYFLNTQDKQYVLTIVERESFEDVEWFMQLIDFFHKKGIPCAQPLAKHNGSFTSTLAGKPATLVEKISGEHKHNVDTEDCKIIGKIMAQLHVTAMEFEQPRSDTRGTIWHIKTVKQLQSYLHNEELALLHAEMALQHDAILSALPQSIIHGDLFRDNVLFNGDDVSGLIDFYFACNGCMIYDLGIAFNDWCRYDDGSKDTKRADALLAGYNSVRPLQQNEQESLPVALRCAALRYWLSRLQDFYFPAVGELTYTKSANSYKRILQRCIAEA